MTNDVTDDVIVQTGHESFSINTYLRDSEQKPNIECRVMGNFWIHIGDSNVIGKTLPFYSKYEQTTSYVTIFTISKAHAQ